jgi:cytochrome bd-type quinol oxidase subunit 2
MSSGNGRRRVAPDVWPWLFAVASPFVAGVVVLATLATLKGGGDFCDPSYSGVDERHSDAARWQWTLTGTGVVMIALGTLVAAQAIRRRRAIERLRLLRLSAAVVVCLIAITGFVYLIAVGDTQTDCGT